MNDNTKKLNDSYYKTILEASDRKSEGIFMDPPATIRHTKSASSASRNVWYIRTQLFGRGIGPHLKIVKFRSVEKTIRQISAARGNF